MKIAIMSDTHDNLATTKKVVDWLNKEKISLLLHCGDINSQEAINEINNNFKGEVKFAKGNADMGLDIPEKDEIKIDNRKIAFCHFKEPAIKLCESGKYDIVFYGHTHKPWEEKINNCRMINPGEMAGQFTKATFAIFDTQTEELQLKIVERL